MDAIDDNNPTATKQVRAISNSSPYKNVIIGLMELTTIRTSIIKDSTKFIWGSILCIFIIHLPFGS